LWGDNEDLGERGAFEKAPLSPNLSPRKTFTKGQGERMNVVETFIRSPCALSRKLL